jgi:hypothetical protein|tara:strand:- start:84 stop:512 length:429 start_codon:yes stop_codon:yes gene_type:complete
MKNLLLILALFVVGCSFEKDTRLLCDCLYYQSTNNPGPFSFFEREFIPKKRDCKGASTTSIVLNVSKQKFMRGEDDISENPSFSDTRISSDEFPVSGLRLKVSLDRTTLIYTSKIGVQDPETPQIYSSILKTTNQCRVVKGI